MPGHSIAAVRELKSSLWATAGGKGAEIRPKSTLAGQAAGGAGLAHGQPHRALQVLAVPEHLPLHLRARQAFVLAADVRAPHAGEDLTLPC